MKLADKKTDFKFDLSQLVNIQISDEWGEVRSRAQHAFAENAYYVHYKAADGRACSAWFDESMLVAVEDENHPGCPVYAAVELPEGATVEE